MGIDQNGNVTHPGDITEQNYRNFLTIAVQHQVYATWLHSVLLGGGISSESLRVYRLRADMFRALHESSPLDEKKIRRRESKGEIDLLMAGFQGSWSSIGSHSRHLEDEPLHHQFGLFLGAGSSMEILYFADMRLTKATRFFDKNEEHPIRWTRA